MTNTEALDTIEDYSGFEAIINDSLELEDEEAKELFQNAHDAYWALIYYLKYNQEDEEDEEDEAISQEPSYPFCVGVK
jgi:hypothetical protein